MPNLATTLSTTSESCVGAWLGHFLGVDPNSNSGVLPSACVASLRDHNEYLVPGFQFPSRVNSLRSLPLRVMPYVPLGDFINQPSNEPSSTFSLPVSASQDSLGAPTNSNSTSLDTVSAMTESSQEMDCVPSPTTASHVMIPSPGVVLKKGGKIQPEETGKSSLKGESSDVAVAESSDVAVADAVKEDAWSSPAYGSSVSKLSQRGQHTAGRAVTFTGMGFNRGGRCGVGVGRRRSVDGDDTFKISFPLNVLKEGFSFGQVSENPNASDSPNILKILFSNWPSIITIVLGFDPNSPSPSSSSVSRPTLSSVHLLDNFTTDLILNCSETMIKHFVDTIICQLNLVTQSCVDLCLLLQDVDYTDPTIISQFLERGSAGTAMLVGRRFLDSVVRVLALEHSRVKNRFLEMQQARHAAAPQAGN